MAAASWDTFRRALFASLHLRLIRIDRRGPRFFVAVVRWRGRLAIFKSAVNPRSVDYWSNVKFGREVEFLTFIQSSPYRQLRRLAPRVYASSVTGRAWYLREYITGQMFNVRGGNIRFRPVFFRPGRLGQITRALAGLQAVRPADLPPRLNRRLRRYDTVARALRVLRPNWPHISRALGDRAAATDLPRILATARRVYDRSPSVLAHHEPYACHFIATGRDLRLIDWENIAWANPLHDYIILWLRGVGHPQWQRRLRAAAERQLRPGLGKKFAVIWDTDLLLQAIFVVWSAPTYPDRADMRRLAAAARAIVQQRLTAYRRRR